MVDRNNKPPVWEQQLYRDIYVKENEPQGHVVTTVRARFVNKEKLQWPKIWKAEFTLDGYVYSIPF